MRPMFFLISGFAPRYLPEQSGLSCAHIHSCNMWLSALTSDRSASSRFSFDVRRARFFKVVYARIFPRASSSKMCELENLFSERSMTFRIGIWSDIWGRFLGADGTGMKGSEP